MQYLHQNGKVCTLVRIKNDEDVENVFRESAGDASAVYLYIQTDVVKEIEHQGKAQRVGSIKGVQPNNPPSILGKRDAAGHILYHYQEFNTNSRINEDAISSDTLPSPKVNPTRKVYHLAPKSTSVVKSCFQQSFPSVDLGADSDLPFTQGGYTCIEENPVVEKDIGLGTDNDNLNWHHVAAERCKEGGYTSKREELPYAENDVGLGTDNDNLVSLHMDTERCKRDYNRGGEELPFAKKEIGLGIDNDNLDSLHVDIDSCKEVPAGYGLGSSRHTECYLEKNANPKRCWYIHRHTIK